MSLHDAIKDLKSAIIGGADLSIADEISTDYGINPVLVIRKLCENVGATTATVINVIRQRANDATQQTLADAKISSEKRREKEIERSRLEMIAITEWFRTQGGLRRG